MPLVFLSVAVILDSFFLLLFDSIDGRPTDLKGDGAVRFTDMKARVIAPNSLSELTR